VPFHIELISALLIHPRHTNQIHPNERLELASRSITLLRNILSILGPLNARLGEAFSFSPITSSRSSRRSRNTLENVDDSTSSDAEDNPERMRGIIANRGRIRRCARDFWHMVGWAFNCSVKYPKRWKYWKVWLDYMLDVLDADWVERERQDNNAGAKKRRGGQQWSLRRCLLVKYLADTKGRSSAVKRVVRSAFADGSPDDLKEFPEVFPNETKELKVRSGQKRKRQDSTGQQRLLDYEDDDAEAAMDSSELTDQTPEPLQDTDDGLAVDSWLGGTESVALRQRLLTLVSRTCFIRCPTKLSSFHVLLPSFPTTSLTVLLSTISFMNALKLFPRPPSRSFSRPLSRHPVRLSCHGLYLSLCRSYFSCAFSLAPHHFLRLGKTMTCRKNY
jgi:hypothetical protein